MQTENTNPAEIVFTPPADALRSQRLKGIFGGTLVIATLVGLVIAGQMQLASPQNLKSDALQTTAAAGAATTTDKFTASTTAKTPVGNFSAGVTAGSTAAASGTVAATSPQAVLGATATTPTAAAPAADAVSNAASPTVAPQIKSFAPLAGKPGDLIYISGYDFDPTAAKNVVHFGDLAATIQSYGNTGDGSQTMVVILPAFHDPAEVPITVATVAGTAISELAFTVTEGVTDIPSIQSITPQQTRAGELIYLNGQNFNTVNAVGFKNAAGEMLAADSAELIYQNGAPVIRVTVPEWAVTGPVRVVSTSGAVAESSILLEIIPPAEPIITGISADAAKVGEPIVIKGTDLTKDGVDTLVQFPGLPAQRVDQMSRSPTGEDLLQVAVPAGAQPGPLKVLVGDKVVESPTTFALLAVSVPAPAPAAKPTVTSLQSRADSNLASPFNLTGTLENGYIYLTWNAPAGDVTGYNIYYGTGSGKYILRRAAGNVTEHFMTNLTVGQRYFFVVTALDGAGRETKFSNEVALTFPTKVAEVQPIIGAPLAPVLEPVHAAALPPVKVQNLENTGPAENLALSVAFALLTAAAFFYRRHILNNLMCK